jgi:hypothetical protein
MPNSSAVTQTQNAAKANNATINYKNTPMIKWTQDVGIVILVLIVTLVIILILVYLVRLFRTTGLKRVDLLPKVIPLDQRSNLPYVIPAGKMAVTTRGQEFSFSLWLYLSEFYENTSSHKLLFMRGNNTNSFNQVSGSTNPIIMLDKATNAIYFIASTHLTTSSSAISLNSVTDPKAMTKHMIAKVDYVPLQRWVHFVMQMRDNIMTIFVDGDIYSITTTNDVKVNSGERPIVRSTAGDGIIGDPNNPIKGFVSKFEFFNYALSHKNIQSIYKSGPVNQSALGALGLGNYGVRSPIYDLDKA